jgi:hypothetical protein
VPSSISSSDARLPRGGWPRTWATTLVLAALLIGAWEIVWRQRGFTPEINDSAGLWALARGRLAPNDPQAVALLGSSRLQLAIDPDAFAAVWGQSPVQLAIAGAPVFLPALENLSRDENFSGVVVCDVVPGVLSKQQTQDLARSAAYVEAYESRSAVGCFETKLRVACQERFVFLRDPLAPLDMARPLLRQRVLPKPQPLHERADRCIEADFSQFAPYPARSLDGLRDQTDPVALADSLVQLRSCVERLAGRGGRVAFVRMPSSGFSWQAEEKRFPRVREWDVLAAQPWARALHFRDDPVLAGFVCPDESHLDQRQQSAFSRRLADLLRHLLNR